MRTWGIFSKVQNEVLSQPRYILALQLTAIFFVLRGYGGSDSKLYNVLIALICVAMLVSKTLLKSRSLWIIISLVMFAVITDRYHRIDNHKYLMFYWALACGLSVGVKNTGRFIEWNGRQLIGLVFAFAVLWKLLAGEYLDGAFFHATFLTDSRFQGLTMLLTGITEDAFKANERLLNYFKFFPGQNAHLTMISTQSLQWISVLAAYWTLFIESMIALTFLLYKPKWFSKVRDIVLIIFLLTTYVIAPVDRFAITLCVLGFSQCTVKRPRLRIAYLVVFLFLQTTRMVPELNEQLIDYLSEQEE